MSNVETSLGLACVVCAVPQTMLVVKLGECSKWSLELHTSQFAWSSLATPRRAVYLYLACASQEVGEAAARARTN